MRTDFYVRNHHGCTFCHGCDVCTIRLSICLDEVCICISEHHLQVFVDECTIRFQFLKFLSCKLIGVEVIVFYEIGILCLVFTAVEEERLEVVVGGQPCHVGTQTEGLCICVHHDSGCLADKGGVVSCYSLSGGQNRLVQVIKVTSCCIITTYFIVHRPVKVFFHQVGRILASSIETPEVPHLISIRNSHDIVVAISTVSCSHDKRTTLATDVADGTCICVDCCRHIPLRLDRVCKAWSCRSKRYHFHSSIRSLSGYHRLLSKVPCRLIGECLQLVSSPCVHTIG